MVEAALGAKAESITVLEVHDFFPLADDFVILSVGSKRQARAVAEAVDGALSEAGDPPLSMEGLQEAGWVLLDLGDVLVHIFEEAMRAYYDLEGLWMGAPRFRVEEGPRGAELVPVPGPASPRAGSRPKKARR